MKLLLIAYHFPPDGEIGSVRPYQLARHLPALGIECTILTVDPAHAESLDPLFTPEGLQGVTVVRTPVGRTARDHILDAWRGRSGGRLLDGAGSNESSTSTGVPVNERGRVRQWALEWLAFPDLRYGWREPALAAAERLLASKSFDLVLSTSPPRVGHMVAAGLRQRHGIPWIMDLRDPWFSSWNSPRHERSVRSRLHRRLFSRHAALASAIVTTTERLRAEVASVLRAPAPVVCIPNGLEGSLIDQVSAAASDESRFSLGHFGQIMGGRSEAPFLRGLRRWLDTRPAAAAGTIVRFFGGRSPQGVRLREELGLASQVSYEPRMPRPQVPALVAQQYALLLLANDQPLQVPGKVYEYVASGRRILAVTERDSATGDVLAGMRGCAIAETPEEVAFSLDRLWAEYSAGEPALVRRDEAIRAMSFEARASEYSRLLREVRLLARSRG